MDNETPKQKVIQSSNARSSRQPCVPLHPNNYILDQKSETSKQDAVLFCCILYFTERYLLFKTIVDIFVNLTLI